MRMVHALAAALLLVVTLIGHINSIDAICIGFVLFNALCALEPKGKNDD